MKPKKSLAALLVASILAILASPLHADTVYLSPGSGSFFNIFLFSQIDGISFSNEDILRYDTDTDEWSMYFDGSDVGLSYSNVNAFHLQDDSSILLSFDAPKYIAGLGAVDNSDIVRFIPSSLGTTTAGSFEWYFDGSDVGLGPLSENIDAIGFAPDGRLVISASGWLSVAGVFAQDEDLVAFEAVSLGQTTQGSWTLYVDGSDVGLNTASEDIVGSWINVGLGDIYLTTRGSFSVNGASGTSSDIVRCVPGSLGSTSSCVYSLFWDGSAARWTRPIDGLSLEVNQPPLAQDDAFSTDEDTPITGNDVLVDNGNGPDSDPDSDPLSVSQVNGSAFTSGVAFALPSGALLSMNSNGSFDYDPNGAFEALALGQQGQDSFDYTLADGQGGTATATVTITIEGVDDPPVAVDDTASVTEDDPATTIDILGNDTDVDGGPISINSVTQPANGTVVITNAGADLTYEPDPDYCNDGTPTDDFTYTLTPGSSSATVAVTVTCENDPPVAVDDAVSTDEDTVLNGDVTVANPTTADSDVDGDTLTVGEVNGNAASVGMQITLSSGALLTVNGDGMFSYDPNGQFENLAAGAMTADSFTYQICDAGGLCNTATVNITITGVNDPPVLMLPGLDPVSYPPGGTPVLLDASAELTDIDSANFNGGSFSIDITTNCDNSDLVGIQDSGTPDTDINVSGSNVSYNGTLIATFVQDTSGTPCTEPAPALLISFTDDAANASDQV
ncbi:MAG: tandem-95 repeat protein, partial [Candidatus Competibacteraceae bacterium]|nr:tandem-95 repeat protein [Candidatus Competibacteraceae bacterium]